MNQKKKKEFSPKTPKISIVKIEPSQSQPKATYLKKLLQGCEVQPQSQKKK